MTDSSSGNGGSGKGGRLGPNQPEHHTRRIRPIDLRSSNSANWDRLDQWYAYGGSVPDGPVPPGLTRAGEVMLIARQSRSEAKRRQQKRHKP